MSERDTATVTLTRGEARKVIAALADDEVTESGRDRERLLNLQDHLAAEFGFDEFRDQGTESDVPDGQDAVVGDEDLIDGDEGGVFDLGDEDEEAVELSRGEAEDVLDAMDEYEGLPEDESVVADVRERIDSKFD